MSKLTSFYSRYSSPIEIQAHPISFKSAGVEHNNGKSEAGISTEETKKPTVKNLKTNEEETDMSGLVNFMKQTEKSVFEELSKPFYVPSFMDAEREILQSNENILKGQIELLKSSEIHSQFDEGFWVTEVIVNCLHAAVFVG